MIEVVVNGIFLTQSQASGIILKEKNGKRTLPIVIGEYEAQSIALGLEKIKPPRPITHDLIINMLESCSVQIDSILITELKNNTYFAVIKVTKNYKSWEIDARPSDAIALAVRTMTPIYVEEEVMDVGSYIPTTEETEKSKPLYKVTDNLEKLKEELAKAVENEEYEKAALLRDKIKDLDSNSTTNKTDRKTE